MEPRGRLFFLPSRSPVRAPESRAYRLPPAGGIMQSSFCRSAMVVLWCLGVCLGAAGQSLVVSVDALNFGTHNLGTATEARTVTLTNETGAALSLQIRPAGQFPKDYSITNGCGTSLADGASCEIRVKFAPAAPGPRPAEVQIIDNTNKTSRSITLSGLGFSAPLPAAPTPIHWIWFLIAGSLLVLLALMGRSIYLATTRKDISSARPEWPTAWDSQNSLDSLGKIFAATIGYGVASIEWYQKARRSKKTWSLFLRAAAIALGAIGALLPLIVSLGQRVSWLDWIANSQLGYIAFAGAAACLAVDKFYGFSTGWIRYIRTELTLQAALLQLRYDWFALLAKVAQSHPAPDQVQLMLQKLQAFVAFVNKQVEQETDAWILEFQSGLAELAGMLKSRAEAARPGSLQVTVPNAKDFDGGVKAVLDRGVEERQVEGTQCLFSAVAPGPHEVLVRGTKSGITYEATGVVQVSPNALASLPLPITVPSA